MASFYDRVVAAYPSTGAMGGGRSYSYVRSGQNTIDGQPGQQVLPPSVLESLPVQLVNRVAPEGVRGALIPVGVDESKLPAGTTSIMGAPRYRGGSPTVTGYQVPIDVPGMQEKDARGNAMPKFVAEYDSMGNFKQITTKDKYYLTSGKGKDDIFAKPIIDPSGRLVDSQASTQAIEDKQGSNFLGALASFVLPAIFPGVGSAISSQLMNAGISSPAVANAIGQGLFSSGATALGGGSTQDIIKAGLTSGLISGATSALKGTTPSVTTAPPTVGAGTAGMSGVDIATGMTGTTALPTVSPPISSNIIPPYQAQPVTLSMPNVTPISTPVTTIPAPIELPPPPPAPVTPPPAPTAPPTDAFSGLTGADIAVGMSGAGAAPGVAASTLPITASTVGQMVASQGLTSDLVKKVSEITGLDTSTVSSLGSAAVQSLLSAYGASKTAEQQKEASQTLANAQIEAAKIAAEAAKFRPVGVTTRFGTSKFTTDEKGNVIGASYTPSEEILGYQQRLSTLAGRGLTQAEEAPGLYKPLIGAGQRLFSLGEQYLGKSPEAVAADYIAKQQALLAPSRQTQLAELQNKLMQQGRLGAAVSQGGTLMPTSPEMAAYYNALAQQDLQLAAAGDTEAQRRIQFGAGLFDTGAGLTGKYYTGQTAAYQPFATAMDTTAGLESLAQQPMALGTQIGARTTAGAAESGRLLSQGITGAAQTMYPSQAFSGTGQFVSGLAQSPLVKSAISSAFGVPQQPTQQMYTFDPIKNQFIPVSSAWST